MPFSEMLSKIFTSNEDDKGSQKADKIGHNNKNSTTKDGLSRREALGTMGKLGALGAMTAVELNMIGGKHPVAEASGTTHHDAEHREKVDKRFETVNLTTAAAVSGLFVNWVRRCAKGDSFGSQSALELNAAEAVRIAMLQTLGGDKGKEKAAEESAAVYESLMLVPALITASDFTARAVAVHPERIFKEAEDIIEGTKEQERARPPFEAEKREWQEYLLHVNDRITKEVAELEALSTAIAPFLTTYTSSAVSNRLKENIMHLTFEQSVARSVLEKQQQTQAVAPERVLEESVSRTQELFDGPLGFNNLQTTLAANINGGFLLGDPPQVYGFKNHKNNLERLAKAEALGLANSEIMTAALTSVWLKKMDIPLDAQFYKTYFSAQTRVLGEIGKLGSDALRAGGRVVLDKILRSKGGSHGEAVAEGLEAAQIPAISLSLRDYARVKAEHVRALSKQGGEQIQRLAAALIKGSNESPAAGSTQALDFSPEGLAAAGARTEAMIGVADHAPTAEFISPDTALITDEDPYASMTIEDPELEQQIMQVYRDAQDRQRGIHTPESVNAILEQVPETVRALLKDYFLHPAQHTRTPEQIARIIDTIPDERVAQEIRSWLPLAQTTKHNTTPEHHAPDHKEGLLSHSAQEVLWALGSQIPCVEPLAETVKAGVGKAFGIKGGAERTSEKKLVAAIGTVLSSEMVISSLADNIAAYLFGEKVLVDMVKEVYGADVLEKYPSLGDVLYATTIKLAEQAGALTKFGNGPNFSQERMVAGVDAQGVLTIKRDAIPFAGYTNQYANIANGALLALSLNLVRKEIARVERGERKAA